MVISIQAVGVLITITHAKKQQSINFEIGKKEKKQKIP